MAPGGDRPGLGDRGAFHPLPSCTYLDWVGEILFGERETHIYGLHMRVRIDSESYQAYLGGEHQNNVSRDTTIPIEYNHLVNGAAFAAVWLVARG